MTKEQFKALKKGVWLFGTDGIREVTSEYDESRGTIGTAEVYMEDGDGGEYTLHNENPFTTYTDVRKSSL